MDVDDPFEKELITVDELDDPLTVFEARYYRLQSTRPPTDPTLIQLLDFATRKFVDDRRYRNDPRYLRLWLAYARLVRDPNDVFAFLPTRDIAADLAAYYEEYASYLEGSGQMERALDVLRRGVERGAQPVERLRRRLNEFVMRYPPGAMAAIRIRVPERPAYDVRLIEEGRVSFEEMRARGWRRAGSILKGGFMPLATTFHHHHHQQQQQQQPHQSHNFPGLLEADDEEIEVGGEELPDHDPDQLTHVSIYKDNTFDLRELARRMGPGSNQDNQHGISTIPTNGYGGATLPTDLLEGCLVDHRMGARLSLIPEESDVATAVSGMISTMLTGGTTLNKINSMDSTINVTEFTQLYLSDGAITICAERLLPRLSILNRSLRGVSGNAHDVNESGGGLTVSSINTPVGNLFITRQLSEYVFLAMDLSVDYLEEDLQNVVLKIVPDISVGLKEAAILRKIHGKTYGLCILPKVSRIVQYFDAVLLVLTPFYEHGELTRFLNQSPNNEAMTGVVDEKLVLFWSRQLAHALWLLHEQGVAHGAIRPEHVMLRIRTQPTTPQAWLPDHPGWEDLGVALVGGFGRTASCIEMVGERRFQQAIEADWQDYLRLVQLLVNSANGRRYECTWQSLFSITPTTMADAFGEAVRLLDEALVREATILPPLKSLLIKLETERYLRDGDDGGGAFTTIK